MYATSNYTLKHDFSSSMVRQILPYYMKEIFFLEKYKFFIRKMFMHVRKVVLAEKSIICFMHFTLKTGDIHVFRVLLQK